MVNAIGEKKSTFFVSILSFKVIYHICSNHWEQQQQHYQQLNKNITKTT